MTFQAQEPHGSSPELLRQKVLQEVAQYYAGTLRKHGPTPRGVDWNGAQGQCQRYHQLLKVIDRSAGEVFSINEIGCGYGALVTQLEDTGRRYQYVGFDIAHEMVAAARSLHSGLRHAVFQDNIESMTPADYTLASGIFNVKFDCPAPEWLDYICGEIDLMSRLSRCGFAFNALTHYADSERKRTDLFYADPAFFMDYVMRKHTRYITVLHDYPLYEWTLIARKAPCCEIS